MKVSDLRIGLPVEYLGDADPEVVRSHSLRAIGMALFPNHPGRVWSTTPQHVQVTWAGLEDEPATYATGFGVPAAGCDFYPALGLLTEEEFAARERAIRASIATGKPLSGSAPPWRAALGRPLP